MGKVPMSGDTDQYQQLPLPSGGLQGFSQPSRVQAV
jgi:hypothetical protein